MSQLAKLRYSSRINCAASFFSPSFCRSAQAQSTVKPGGTLIYSTCTTTVEEDEKNVEWFLENYEEFTLDKRLPWTDETGENVGSYKLSPLKEGTDGFFIAIFKRGEN